MTWLEECGVVLIRNLFREMVNENGAADRPAPRSQPLCHGSACKEVDADEKQFSQVPA
jgi:hypothetical protein